MTLAQRHARTCYSHIVKYEAQLDAEQKEEEAKLEDRTDRVNMYLAYQMDPPVTPEFLISPVKQDETNREQVARDCYNTFLKDEAKAPECFQKKIGKETLVLVRGFPKGISGEKLQERTDKVNHHLCSEHLAPVTPEFLVWLFENPDTRSLRERHAREMYKIVVDDDKRAPERLKEEALRQKEPWGRNIGFAMVLEENHALIWKVDQARGSR